MSSPQQRAAYPRVRDGYTLLAEIESAAGARLHRRDSRTRTPEEARSRFAAAMGYALAGERSSVWLSGRDLRANLDLLADAVTQRIPMVIYLELEADHGPAYLAAESGMPLALAGTMQSLLDWSCIMRRTGEDSLLPTVVAFERLETGRSPSDLVWPGDASILQYLGTADQRRATSVGPEQTLLSEIRRSLPAWFDPDRPLSLGVQRDPWTEGAGRAATQVHLDPLLLRALEDARSRWSEVTGRAVSGLRSHEATGRVERTIVTTGPAFERVVEGLGETANVLAVEQLAPLFSPKLENETNGQVVWTLDRAAASFEGTSPLSRLLGLHESGDDDSESHERGPGRALRRFLHRPVAEGHAHVRHAIWGLGGEPLCAADVALLPTAEADPPQVVYLGQDFVPSGLIEQPHREAYFDGLRRDHPELAQLGLRASALEPASTDPGGARESGIRVRFQNQPSQTSGGFGAPLEFLSHLLGCCLREISLPHAGQSFREFVLWDYEGARPQVCHAVDLIVSTGAAGHPLVLARGVGSLRAPEEDAADRSLGSHVGLPDPNQAALILEGLRRGREDLRKSLDDPEVRARLSRAEHDEELHAREQWVETVLIRAQAAVVVTATAASDAAAPGVTHSSSARSLVKDPPDPLRMIPTDGSLVDPARFRNQIAKVWNRQPVDSEPGVAVPTLPPWSNSLWNARGESKQPWPEFEAGACTVCGDCWSTCPEGAIEVRWVDGVNLVRRWTDLVQEAELDASPLRRSGRGLAAAMNAPVDATPEAGPPKESNAYEVISRTLNVWAEKSQRNRETEPALRKLLESVSTEFSQIPLSRPLQEDGQPAPGVVFASLAVDPDPCTGCGLCAWICPSEALEANGTRVDLHRQTLAAVRSLPDPDADALERTRSVCGPVTASMTLSTVGRAFSGRPEVPGSGQASALRLVLASLEPGPERQELLAHLKQLQAAVAERVEREVGRAVAPTEFDRMARDLETTGPDALDLRHLADGLDQANRDGRLNSEDLARGVEMGRQLADLRWRLESASGLGRRSFGLVLGPGLGWAATFPHNPVAAPVWNSPSATFSAMAEGLVAAEEERSGREIAWLRSALRMTEGTESLAKPSGVGSFESPATSVRYEDRSDEEWGLSPRLVVVVDETAWTPTRKELEPLLTEGGRVWIVLLAPVRENSETADPTGKLVRTLAGNDAWALQSSPAAPRHLSGALAEIARSHRPAVLRLLVPEPVGNAAEPADDAGTRVAETEAAWNNAQSALVDGTFALGLWTPEGTKSRVSADARLGDDACARALGTPKVVTSAEVVALQKQIESLQNELAATGKRVREETESELVQRLARRLGEVSRQAQATTNGEAP